MHFVDAKGILSAKNGMNVYRGCTHGCIYCDSRSLCYQMNHKFEDIEVKRNAAVLLEDALRKKRRKCMIGTGSMCDPYMPCEEELQLTHACLELIDRYGFGATLITKSSRVLQDLPLLQSINTHSKCVVQMTLTSFSEPLCRILEPHVSTSKERFETLLKLQEARIPTVVWFTPLLPFINDTEENLRGILDYCFTAKVKGIICFGIGVTLRQGNREYFYAELDKHFPGKRELYQKKYGNAYAVTSDNNGKLMHIFKEECRSHNVLYEPEQIFSYLNEYPQKSCAQYSLFDDADM